MSALHLSSLVFAGCLVVVLEGAAFGWVPPEVPPKPELSGNVTARDLPEFIPPEGHAERMAWFEDARFGVFLTWGPYAHFRGDYNGTKIREGCFAAREAKIPFPEYREAVRAFSPDAFDADELVAHFKAVGFRYLILMAKHADGFAMWFSESSEFDLEDGTAFDRDILKEYVEACKKHDMRYGIYYCFWDWASPDASLAAFNDWTWDIKNAVPQRYYKDKVLPEVTELASQYEPDFFWFDVPGGTAEQAAELVSTIRKYRPNCIINNRLPGGGAYNIRTTYGDYHTPETFIPEFASPRVFEVCDTISRSWGYTEPVVLRQEPAEYIKELGTIISKGGNYALNTALNHQGLISNEEGSVLTELKRWMDINSLSIYGAGKSPLPPVDFGVVTAKKNRLFLHIHNWPENGKLLLPSLANPIKAIALTSPGRGRRLKTRRVSLYDHEIEVGSKPWGVHLPVVLVAYGDDPIVHPLRPLSTGGLPSAFRVSASNPGGDIEVDVNHKEWRWEVKNWNEPRETLAWPPVRVLSPGSYTVSMAYGIEPSWAGNTFDLTIGDQTIAGVVKSGHWDKAKASKGSIYEHSLGEVTLSPGEHPISLSLTRLNDGADNLFNLRTVTFTPVDIEPVTRSSSGTSRPSVRVCPACNGTGEYVRNGTGTGCGDCAGTGSIRE